VERKWGKVVGDPLPPGLYFYNPVSSGILELDVRERKVTAKTACFTIDIQKVDVDYAVTYYPDPMKIGVLYSQFGKEWDEKIVNQVVLGSLKDTVGQYKADDLVGKREHARMGAEKELKAELAKRNVVLTKLDFVNLDFDDAYEKAVEAKVVAIQKAAEAKNKTVEVEEKALQTIASAKADAEAMRIKSQALSQNKGLVSYEAIQKWNGQLPTYMFGNTVPMINLDKLKQND
jgi:regulator of protease activity HflC (stomatin/prohibitin superfamily)